MVMEIQHLFGNWYCFQNQLAVVLGRCCFQKCPIGQCYRHHWLAGLERLTVGNSPSSKFEAITTKKKKTSIKKGGLFFDENTLEFYTQLIKNTLIQTTHQSNSHASIITIKQNFQLKRGLLWKKLYLNYQKTNHTHK